MLNRNTDEHGPRVIRNSTDKIREGKREKELLKGKGWTGGAVLLWNVKRNKASWSWAL